VASGICSTHILLAQLLRVEWIPAPTQRKRRLCVAPSPDGLSACALDFVSKRLRGPPPYLSPLGLFLPFPSSKPAGQTAISSHPVHSLVRAVPMYLVVRTNHISAQRIHTNQ